MQFLPKSSYDIHGSTASLKQILAGCKTVPLVVPHSSHPLRRSDDKGGVSIGGASLWMLRATRMMQRKQLHEICKISGICVNRQAHTGMHADRTLPCNNSST
ncbi:MAG: hypothetical protein ACLUGJ_16240 [Blautia wexlerae]